MTSTAAIPNLADDDDETSLAETLVGALAPEEDTLVGTLPKAPASALVGTLPKAPGIEDDEDDTALESTLVGDPWDTTEVNGRPSEVRALRPTPGPSLPAPTRPGRASVAPAAKPAAKPVPTKAAPKPTVPRASTKEQRKPPPLLSKLPMPPPLPVALPEPEPIATREPEPAVATREPEPAGIETLDHTAPFPSAPAAAPVVPSAEVEAEEAASLRRMAASPVARLLEVSFALILFVAYLCRALVERLVSVGRPLWAQASRDAAARVYRR